MKKNICFLSLLNVFLLSGCSLKEISFDRSTIYYVIAVLICIVLVLSIILNLIKIKGEGSYKFSGEFKMKNEQDNAYDFNDMQVRNINSSVNNPAYIEPKVFDGLQNNNVNVVNGDLKNNMYESLGGSIAFEKNNFANYNNGSLSNANIDTENNVPTINVNSKSVAINNHNSNGQ